MKRLAIVLPLVVGLAMPLTASPSSSPLVPCMVSELPWSTVSAVLKQVEDVRDYSYTQLVDWYQAGLVTVDARSAAEGGGYVVRITDTDGILDVLIIEGF